jgi:hypothetical protein
VAHATSVTPAPTTVIPALTTVIPAPTTVTPAKAGVQDSAGYNRRSGFPLSRE